MPEIRTKLPYQSEELIPCPSCGYRQKKDVSACEACGIVISKHLAFTPIKASINKFMSPRDISEIRKTQDKLTKVQHDVGSKMELIVHCQKEKLLDMAAYHMKKDNDKTGLEVIRKLSGGIYTDETNGRLSRLLSLFSRPLILIPALLFVFLLIMTMVLRSYVH